MRSHSAGEKAGLREKVKAKEMRQEIFKNNRPAKEGMSTPFAAFEFQGPLLLPILSDKLS
jgi:hypothetical protein